MRTSVCLHRKACGETGELSRKLEEQIYKGSRSYRFTRNATAHKTPSGEDEDSEASLFKRNSCKVTETEEASKPRLCIL